MHRRFEPERRKVFALPLSVAMLAAISAAGIGSQAGALSWGFVQVWADPVILPLLGIVWTTQALTNVNLVTDSGQTARTFFEWLTGTGG